MRRVITLLALALFALPVAQGQDQKSEEVFKPKIRGPIPRLTPATTKLILPKGSLISTTLTGANQGVVNNGMFRFAAEGSGGSAWYSVDGKQLTPYNSWAYGTFDVDVCSFTRREDDREKGIFQQRAGILHRDGNVVLLPLEYVRIGEFEDGLAIATYNRKVDYKNVPTVVYIDIYGRQVFPHLNGTGDYFPEHYPRSMSEGLRAFQDFKTKLWGYINEGGKIVIPAIFHKVHDFSDGLAAVAIEIKEKVWRADKYIWSYIDPTGKVVLNKVFEGRDYWLDPCDFNDGYALVRTPSDISEPKGFKPYYYIDKSGAKVSPDYYFASDFKEGYALAMQSPDDTYSAVINRLFVVTGFTRRLDHVNSIFPEFHSGAFFVHSNQRTANIKPNGKIMVGSDHYNTKMEPFKAPGQATYATKNTKEGVIQGIINRSGEFNIVFEIGTPDATASTPKLKERRIESEKFPIPTHRLSIVATPPLGGTATGSGVYGAGKAVTLTAKCAENHRFMGWFWGEEMLSRELVYLHYTKRFDQQLTARFVSRYAKYADDKESNDSTRKKGSPEPLGSSGEEGNCSGSGGSGGGTGTGSGSGSSGGGTGIGSGSGRVGSSKPLGEKATPQKLSPQNTSMVYSGPFHFMAEDGTNIKTTAYMEFDPTKKMKTPFGENQYGVFTLDIDPKERLLGPSHSWGGKAELKMFVMPFRIDNVQTLANGKAYLYISGGGVMMWDFVIRDRSANLLEDAMLLFLVSKKPSSNSHTNHEYRMPIKVRQDGSVELGVMERYTHATGWVDPDDPALRRLETKFWFFSVNMNKSIPKELFDKAVMKPNMPKREIQYAAPSGYEGADTFARMLENNLKSIFNMMSQSEKEYEAMAK